MDFKKLNVIVGWVIFAIASFAYLSTIEPTASFWDCGEFIATAYKLEVGHPPGAPFFMILGRFASWLAVTLTGSVDNAAMGVNILSALSSSFTILFLFWTITAFGKKLGRLGGATLDSAKKIAIIGSGAVGALAYTFSDSFWFSAVEGEVYAISSLFTALVFWAIMKWDSEESSAHADRWIIFIAYMMGLSIGVHLLNLLTIPAIALVVYFRNREYSFKGLLLTGAIALGILGFIQAGIIPGLVKLAGGYEIFFTNTLGTPFNIGVALFSILLVTLLVQLIMYSRAPKGGLRTGIFITLGLLLIPLLGNSFLSASAKVILALVTAGIAYVVVSNKRPSRLLHMATMCFTVIVIGYSTFAMIVIRSAANPPMDENNPENVFTLLSYLNREQYGDRPLLSGHYWMAPAVDRKDGNPVYMKAYTVKKGDRDIKIYNNPFDAQKLISENGGKGYEMVKEYHISDTKKDALYEYDDQFKALFPRMYSTQPRHIEAYQEWSDMKGVSVRVRDPETGGTKTIKKPTALEDINFFFRYQVSHMYWRYFMWNYAGRQNDQQGHGGILDGNWLSGVNAIDSQRLGDQSTIPPSMADNRALNKFYFIPLLLGLIGLIYHLIVDTKNWLIVMLLFLLTGLAIVVYLNQYPFQPRERDYAYVGSFYAFAIWIGLGVYGIFDGLRRMDRKGMMTALGAIVGTSLLIYVFESGDGDHSFSYTLAYLGVLGLVMMGLGYITGKGNRQLGAIVATGLGLIAPILMAADGWDDHNRAERRTGVDFAKNYLDSCTENAILFTNGDNDTFPLWYVQEVEGYRTDVRVVNLSLLNTDWYIDQMKRKAYDSDPVPFSLTEEKYRQGTRDIVLLNPKRSDKAVNLKQAIDFVADDGNTLDIQTAGKLHYFPSNEFSIPLDKQQLLRDGVIAAEDTANVYADMRWKVGGQYILKNNLMALDLLAHMDWERDIYYAVTTGPDTYINLDPYFELTGMAYRVTPIRHEKSNNPNKLGGVDTEAMYDNVMNKFQWGGMDTKDIYMDENNIRMTTNIRLQMSNLAEELIEEKKNDKAKDVLDKTFEAMPEETVPFTRVVLPLIENYAKIGDEESAEKYALRLFEIVEQDQSYFTGLEPRFLHQVGDQLQINQYVAQRMLQMAKVYKLEGLESELEARVRAMEAEYQQAQQTLKENARRKSRGDF